MGVWSTFREALRLLIPHRLLFATLILTIWLPANLLINILDFSGALDESLAFRLPGLIEFFFGPICVCATLHALSEIKQARTPHYWTSLRFGLGSWSDLFKARLIANVLIFLGFLALVIPGILLWLRWALMDSTIVLEDLDPSAARKRSSELTRGLKARILGAATIYLLWAVMILCLRWRLGEVEFLNTIAAATILDCFADLLLSILTAVLFVFYWNASHPAAQPLTSLPLRTESELM